MKFELDIPDDLLRKAQAIAEQRDISFDDLLVRGLSLALETRPVQPADLPPGGTGERPQPSIGEQANSGVEQRDQDETDCDAGCS